MAASRPVVLVFQEFATLSSSPATPELNCLVAGPAYWIQDFPDDRADIKWGAANAVDYGAAATAAATGVATLTSAVVRADVPNNVIGAVLDTASVKVYASKAVVEMAFGGDLTTALLSETVSSAGTDFAAAGVLPLDTIIITNAAGSTTVTRTVVSVVTSTLRLNSDSTFAAVGNAKFRVQRAVTEAQIDSSQYTFVSATNSVQVNALATLNVGVSPKLIVSSELYVAYRSLRQDLADVKTLGSVNEIAGQLGRIDARNPLAAGVFVALQNTNTTVQYFGIQTNDLPGFTAMKNSIAGRKDVYAVVPLCSGDLATAVLAGLKAEFASLADPDYAVTNGVPQKFRVAIGSSAALPTTKIVTDTNIDGKTEVYAAMAAPTTYHTLSIPTGVAFKTAGVLPGDTLIISGDTTTPTAATATLTLSANVPDATSVSIGTKTYTFKTILSNVDGYVLIGATASDSIDNLVAAINLGAGSGVKYAASTTANAYVSAAAGAGDTMDVLSIALGVSANLIVVSSTSLVAVWGTATLTGATGANRDGTYVVAQVLSETSLELDTELLGGVQANTGGSLVVKIGATTGTRIPLTTITGATSFNTVVDAKLYLDLYDANGTFVDAGVIPTDLLEMPVDPSSDSFTNKDSWKVAAVVSNQRLRIVNNGRSNSLVANELPHGVSRRAPTASVLTTENLRYRVTRALDKAGQVTAIIAVAQGMASRRVINVWPDLCDVSGLVDGSLPRDPAAPTTPQPAATQPGYYLACAVGGMTAGLPSHQGFTNLGIAGVSKIYNANTYFSDKNITDISNGGWFVFQQDTPQALPYVVHQLTTDVSTLQSGEFSMVKNFDFVSLFFADILEEYLGIWNINPETMGFIASSISGGIDNLKLRRRPRIGAPLIDGKIVSIAVSTVSADRLEAYVECQFPAPLNTIALHLVSA